MNKLPHSETGNAHSKDKCEISGGVHVRGVIETHLSTELVKEYQSANSDTNTRENYRFVVECVTLVFVIIVAFLSYIQSRQTIRSTDAAVENSTIARAAYEATVRPYVEVQGINTLLQDHPSIGGNPSSLSFNVAFKNYGSIPAQDLVSTRKVILNGISIPSTKIADRPLELPPGETTLMLGYIGWDDAPKVISGQETLTVYTSFSYSWRDKHDTGCEKFQYYPGAKNFANLGPICYPN